MAARHHLVRGPALAALEAVAASLYTVPSRTDTHTGDLKTFTLLRHMMCRQYRRINSIACYLLQPAWLYVTNDTHTLYRTIYFVFCSNS